MDTRIIGIDLAVTAVHKAVVLDQSSNQFVTGVVRFHTDPAEIEHLLALARAGTSGPTRLVAVLEATGMSWYMVGVYLERAGVEVYRVNGQQVADLRRVYQRHAKSDRIDARVLARLFLLHPERLHRLVLPSAEQIALQRACRELNRQTRLIAATKRRLLATDQFAWLSLCDFLDPYQQTALWVRENWYDPWRVHQAGETTIADSWRVVSPAQPADTRWVAAFCQRAQQVCALYGHPATLDYAQLQTSVQREQARLRDAQNQAHFLRLRVVRPLYRHLHPQRHLETLPGVGQDSAAVYIAFVGDITRFPSVAHFRGWSGLTPFSRQSAEAQARGLHITQAGPSLIKATAFLDASVARLYDPQIAALYHDQMVNRGKHYLQAICACATHLLDRIYVILRNDRPYELRDVDGTPLTKRRAHDICRQRYHVPDEVRQRNNHRVRQARAQERIERRTRTLQQG